MNFLANENFPYPSIAYLKELGHDILSIGETQFGISDRAVMEIAQREGRTILTFDRDYGELIFRLNLKPEKGVIYFRFVPLSPIEPGHILEKALSSGLEVDHCLTVLERESVRQRKYQ